MAGVFQCLEVLCRFLTAVKSSVERYDYARYAIPNVQNTAFLAQIHILTTRKRSKIIATAHVSWSQNYQHCFCGPCFAPDTARGAYRAPPDRLAKFKREQEGKRWENGRDREKEKEGEKRGRNGKGKDREGRKRKGNDFGEMGKRKGRKMLKRQGFPFSQTRALDPPGFGLGSVLGLVIGLVGYAFEYWYAGMMFR